MEGSGVGWKGVGLDRREWDWMEESGMRWKIQGLDGREWFCMEESGVGRKREVGLQRAKNSLLCVGGGGAGSERVVKWGG